ncbi:ATP-binding cassette domain-containing protein [Saccharopolyspora gloriosae]|uniref:ATP-binding cassette domain-containing protein n=1 Tax=Saccharopolyspora gloriosae TaxID=455344 RepID=UPI001FB60A7B|nr:ATP-binding cassette domain-containing protein [Saccharopolyspora gloriosae]
MSGGIPVSGGAVASRVTKRFGRPGREITALDAVDLRIVPGRFTTVIGAANSGKSVLMRCLVGLERPTSGTVSVEGTDLASLSEVDLAEFRRERVGMLFPQSNLLPELTALDNVLLPFDVSGTRPDPALLERVLDVLAVRDLLAQRPTRMSPSERHRIALARILVQQPDIVLADEPMKSLDAVTARHLLRLLRRCCTEFGRTVVFFTADSTSVAYSDRIVSLKSGRVTKDQERSVECPCCPEGEVSEIA